MNPVGASRQVDTSTPTPGDDTSTPDGDAPTAGTDGPTAGADGSTEPPAGGADLFQDFDAWLNAIGPGWAVDFVEALLVLFLAWVISRLMVAIFADRVEAKFRRKALTNAVVRGLRVGVFILGGFTVLSIYGYELGDIALSVTVFTAVVGVVLAPIVGSIISGVFLLADQPYEIGDMVELADSGRRGFVDDITLRYTKIFTLDNTFLVVPNGTMRERDVINYSAEDARTRLSLSLLVTYESDVPRARELAESAAASVDNVISGGPAIRIGAERYPAGPVCYIDEFGDHGVALTLRYWTERPFRLLALRSTVQTAIREAYQDANVEFAYPHSHLVFDDTSGSLDVVRQPSRRGADGEATQRRRATRTGSTTGPPAKAGGDPTEVEPVSDAAADEATRPPDAGVDDSGDGSADPTTNDAPSDDQASGEATAAGGTSGDAASTADAATTDDGAATPRPDDGRVGADAGDDEKQEN